MHCFCCPLFIALVWSWVVFFWWWAGERGGLWHVFLLYFFSSYIISDTPKLSRPLMNPTRLPPPHNPSLWCSNTVTATALSSSSSWPGPTSSVTHNMSSSHYNHQPNKGDKWLSWDQAQKPDHCLLDAHFQSITAEASVFRVLSAGDMQGKGRRPLRQCGIKEKALVLLLDGPQFQSQLCIYLSHVLIIQILWGLSFSVCKMGIILPTGSWGVWGL